MKSIVLSLILLFGVATVATAQEKKCSKSCMKTCCSKKNYSKKSCSKMMGEKEMMRGGMMDFDKRADMLKEQLKLNDDQLTKVKATFEKYKEEFENVKKQRAENRKKNMETMKVVNDKIEGEMKAYLTDDQIEEFKKMREENRKRMMKK